MKTETITVNKTAETPNGVQIEIIKPQTSLEQRLLSYLLVGHIKQAKQRGAMPYDLPDNFTIEYLREGTFLASAQGTQSAGSFYEPPRPIAIFGIRTRGGRGFDLIHADAKRQVDAKKGAQQAGPMNTGSGEPDENEAGGAGDEPAEAVSQQGETKQ